MSNIVIRVENLGKLYRLGEVGTGTISHDLNRWWARLRGQEDPYSKVGAVNDRTQKARKGEHVWALKDVSFEVERGEVLGVIGKNGAGKSTLLKLLSRVTSPTTGSVGIKGRVASLLEVGTGFHPEMTGKENIYMNGTILGMTKKEITSKLDEIVDFAGVAKYLDTPTKRYSSGMQVRLAFAVAAFLEPEILIVDEVLAVGDAEFQKRAIGKMQEVSRGEGRTVLFVSHNMATIRELCGRCVLLKDGTIGLTSSVVECISEYLKTAQNAIIDPGDKEGAVIFNIELDLEQALNGNVVIRVGFNSPEIFNQLNPGIIIKDQYGHAIIGSNFKMHSKKRFSNVKRGTVEFKFKDPPLHEGDYSVSVFLNDGEVNLDQKADAIRFNFIPKKVVKSKPPLHIIGVMNLRPEITMNSNEYQV